MRYIEKTGYVIVALMAAVFMAGCCQERKPLQIIVTNDSHSQVMPLHGKGGFEARMWLINSLREENPNTLLVDAGDIFQGTPYFNEFKGRVEVEAYNLMGYDAMTLGNHEFDNGLDTLAARIGEMDFPVVCANYDVTGTPLEGLVKPYTVIERGGWRVGVFGLGVNPEGLILQNCFRDIKYIDPIEAARKCVRTLREKERCDAVILLSHLGYEDENETGNVADVDVVAATEGIDVILGGHTHQVRGVFMHANAAGDTIPVIQEAKSALDIYSLTLTDGR